jgi:phosphoesterase RecJ-like protein
MLEETGARMDETDGIVAELRSIGTVEVSVLLKEMGPKDVKVSLRSKRVVDVAAIAQSLGGGGHVRAAGCSLNCSVTEAFDLMKEKLTACLGDL